MGESSFFFTGPTFTSFWRLVSWHFFNFTVWIIKECILWWLWVRLCSWLSFCHWWKVNSTDHFSSTLTKLDSVTIMVKENPPAGTSKSLLLSPLNIHSCFLLYLIRLEFQKCSHHRKTCFLTLFISVSWRNHCAYVVEKTVSFTVQEGAAPYVKAEYNKCSWGQKCPTLK